MSRGISDDTTSASSAFNNPDDMNRRDDCSQTGYYYGLVLAEVVVDGSFSFVLVLVQLGRVLAPHLVGLGSLQFVSIFGFAQEPECDQRNLLVEAH